MNDKNDIKKEKELEKKSEIRKKLQQKLSEDKEMLIRIKQKYGKEYEKIQQRSKSNE